ncbi:MAG: carbon-nitrogen hydrolase family protein [bacterium]|nr:carbon-nitrogen hydrolase family protein [bacterium]
MSNIRCAAVQLDAGGLGTTRTVLTATARFVEAAAGAGSQLVIFPAHTGTLYVAGSLGMDCPFLEPWPQERTAEVADAAGEWLRAARRLASGYHVTLLPGTVVWPTGVPAPGGNGSTGPHGGLPGSRPPGAWHHAAPLITPDGRVVRWQVQTHLTAAERHLGWVPGDELRPADTPSGRVGILIGTDLWYPEAARILALQDAVVLACPVAVSPPYGERHQWRGLWQQVQQNQVFGVEAGLCGAAAGVRWQSRTAAVAPVEMTAGETGWLAVLDREGDCLLTTDLDVAALQEVVRAYDIFSQLNPVLYARYLPAIYERWRGE